MDQCSADLLICMAEYLNAKDILAFSSCSRSLYYLKGVESLWKHLCWVDFGLRYNHPDQLYRVLYENTFQRKFGRRLPCSHLSSLSNEEKDSMPIDVLSLYNVEQVDEGLHYKTPACCSQCPAVGVSNLYICVHSNCYKIVCDRHSRLHTRQHYDPRHSIFLKANTAELFCQACIDWLGGIDSDQAEQYKTQQLLNRWLSQLYPSSKKQQQVMSLQQKRRYERHLRWKDTPRNIIMATEGFCFIPAQWIVSWELFVEGWSTMPPALPINPDQWRQNHGAGRPSISFSPSSPQDLDLVIISNRTWSYMASHYTVLGSKLTEDDLQHREMYKNWQQRLNFWKSRILL